VSADAVETQRWPTDNNDNADDDNDDDDRVKRMAAAAVVTMMRVTAACVATSMLQVDRDIGILSVSADRINERAASIDLSVLQLRLH